MTDIFHVPLVGDSANKINDILRGKAYIRSSYFITVLIIQEA